MAQFAIRFLELVCRFDFSSSPIHLTDHTSGGYRFFLQGLLLDSACQRMNTTLILFLLYNSRREEVPWRQGQVGSYVPYRRSVLCFQNPFLRICHRD